MKILIADNDIDILLLVTKSLEKSGHEIVTVENGAKAINVLESSDPPSLAILDWNMPEISGLDVICHIQNQLHERYVYTILLTARTEKKDMLRGLECGADDYIKKPFDRQELQARITAGERTVALKQEILKRNQALKEMNHQLVEANQRMQKDLQTAAAFQNNLLPNALPQLKDFRLGWAFLPCDELAGDMLNAFILDDRHLGFYLLDVSGHGVTASFMTGTVSHLLMPLDQQSSLVRKKDNETGGYRLIEPKNVAAQLNQQFYFDEDSLHYFTIIYGILDLVTREVQFVSAGHPAPILLNHALEPTVTEASGLPIGFSKNVEYRQCCLTLEPGQRLYLYSDGIIEAMNEGKDVYGVDRLCTMLQHTGRETVDRTIHNLIKDIKNWNCGSVEDDMSILAIEAIG